MTFDFQDLNKQIKSALSMKKYRAIPESVERAAEAGILVARVASEFVLVAHWSRILVSLS